MSEPTLNDWAWIQTMMSQAMLGEITDNFRQIELAYQNGEWWVKVILKTDNDEDREGAFDIADDLSDFLEDITEVISAPAYAKVNHEVVVNDGLLVFERAPNRRLVFKKKVRTIEPDQSVK